MSIGALGGTLDFALPKQEGDFWCWAACASAVANYFEPLDSWTQCAVAGATLRRTDCCDGSGACDHPSYVYRALEATGNLASRFVGPVSRRMVVAELKQGKPIVIRIQYPRIGHFVVIDGYRAIGTIHLRDPIDESERDIRISALEGRYNQVGVWSHTYFTRAHE